MGSNLKKVFQDPVGRLAGKAFGKKTFASIDLGGQVLGQYDELYKPDAVEPAPSPLDTGGEAYTARDNIRRRAAKAQGRDSTIRTSALGAPYTGSPAKLLGG